MKHLVSIVISVIAVVTSGCASTETASEASANRTCFNIREITSWSSIDNKHLYIEGIRSDSKYLFTMFSSCYGIEFSQVIALSNPMSRLCSNDFGRVTYRDGSRRMSCNIDNIEQVASKADAEGIVEARGKKN
ncbi:MAG: hypothetical protein IIA09_11340 [Proteobacteria bacterium]|nr:hypothetical protein [Pseudomonadota bacterium]